MRNISIIALFCASLIACENKGQINFDDPVDLPSVNPPQSSTPKGFRITPAGRSLIIEQGQTQSTGYHGWIHTSFKKDRVLSAPGYQMKLGNAVE